jgi:serine/threonine-protein kinase
MLISEGTRLGRYEIRSQLGAGGMGEVYLAKDTKLNRKVAIKFLATDSSQSERANKRLLREARAAATLDHPNICAIHEVGEEEARSFIVMQYVEGETLDVKLKYKPLELKESLALAEQIADALAEAHSRGIIHRDIKPSNIIITSRGQAKVMDFGLAKLIQQSEVVHSEAETEALLSTPGEIIGTVPYMSPEQVRGLPVDARTDIWSLGVLLYEMVARRLPFPGATPTDRVAAILEREPEPLERLRRGIPPELERIVGRALAKNRDERYTRAADLAEDLRRLRTTQGEERKFRFTVPAPARILPAFSHPHAAVASLMVIARRYVSLPVLLASSLLLIGAVSSYFYLNRSRPTVTDKTPIDSIAVMPLVNASADPNAEYLSDGITETIINSLAQLPELRVMARSTVFRYKGREVNPQEVGRDLNVRAVLAGRVLRLGDRLIIRTELVDTRDGAQIWGEQYNRSPSDILVVQAEIAREISDKLQVNLTAQEQKRLIKRYTDNTEAYEAYLKGRHYWNKRTAEDFKKSIEYFQQAIEKDPRYALAYAGLADSYILLATYNILPPTEAIPKARMAAMKALEIDDELAEAHISLAAIEGELEWNWSIAEKEFKQAIKINPNYATAHLWYGEYLVVLGRFDEALAEIKRAHQLDPLSLVVNIALGDVFYYTRRYDEAIEQYGKTLEIDSNFAFAYSYLGSAYLQKGMYAEAIAKLEKARELSGGEPLIVAWLGYAFALTGEKDKARAMLNELKERSKREYISPYCLAIIYAGLDKKEQAFEYLQKAYEERSSWLLRLKAEPKFDSLRSDQRFADLLQRVGLRQ